MMLEMSTTCIALSFLYTELHCLSFSIVYNTCLIIAHNALCLTLSTCNITCSTCTSGFQWVILWSCNIVSCMDHIAVSVLLWYSKYCHVEKYIYIYTYFTEDFCLNCTSDTSSSMISLNLPAFHCSFKSAITCGDDNEENKSEVNWPIRTREAQDWHRAWPIGSLGKLCLHHPSFPYKATVLVSWGKFIEIICGF